MYGAAYQAIQKQVLPELITSTGFEQPRSKKIITVPDDILLNHISKEEIVAFKNSMGIYSEPLRKTG